MTTHEEFLREPITCVCGWRGVGRDCRVGEVFERGEISEYHCPACGERVRAVPWPEFKETPKGGRANMKNFFAGLAAAFVGFFIWMTVSVIYGVEAGLTGEASRRPAAFWWIATPAFFLMIGGPIWFWLIGPLWSRLKRKREP